MDKFRNKHIFENVIWMNRCIYLIEIHWIKFNISSKFENNIELTSKNGIIEFSLLKL